MRAAILATVIIIAGCTTAAYPEQFRWAESVCAANGGVDKVLVQDGGRRGHVFAYARCKNGAEFFGKSDDIATFAKAKD